MTLALAAAKAAAASRNRRCMLGTFFLARRPRKRFNQAHPIVDWGLEVGLVIARGFISICDASCGMATSS